MNQAEALVGHYVRFANLPKTMHPTPIRVIAATANGMIRLEGHAGYYQPSLFVIVKPPESEKHDVRELKNRRACFSRLRPAQNKAEAEVLRLRPSSRFRV